MLRKMQIPVKDILRIYESEDMSVVVETFVSRIRAIDEEVNALTDLRRIVNDFLATMTRNGITKISALPLLYEVWKNSWIPWKITGPEAIKSLPQYRTV